MRTNSSRGRDSIDRTQTMTTHLKSIKLNLVPYQYTTEQPMAYDVLTKGVYGYNIPIILYNIRQLALPDDDELQATECRQLLVEFLTEYTNRLFCRYKNANAATFRSYNQANIVLELLENDVNAYIEDHLMHILLDCFRADLKFHIYRDAIQSSVLKSFPYHAFDCTFLSLV